MKIEPVELTADQAKKWEDTRIKLTWECPAFTHIFYSMLANSNSKDIALFSKDVPIAATDGSNLILNPEGYFKFSLDERVFIAAHEIMHAILNHCVMSLRLKQRGTVPLPNGKTLPYDHQTMNVAMDYVINDALKQSGVGKMPDCALHDTSIAQGEDSVIDVYAKVFKEQNGNSGSGQGQGQGQGKGFDVLLDPGTSEGKDANEAASERSDAKWQTAVSSALATARLKGNCPAALERILGGIIEPKVDWKDKIAGIFARKVGSGSYDWQRPDRRLIIRDIVAPGRTGHGAGTVVIGVDTSGSINQDTLNTFFSEMAGILDEVRPKRTLIVWCDAQIGRVDEVEDISDLYHVKKKGAPGGGGTAFEPVFNYITSEGIEPDALVYLTDGLGSFPAKAPEYPVIWGNIYPHSTYPFGDVVDIPV